MKLLKKFFKNCNQDFSFEMFNSLNELASVNQSRPHRGGNFLNTKEESVTKRSSWSGNLTYDEAYSMLKNGYHEGAKDIKLQLKTNKAKQNEKIKFINSVVGFAPIVPLAIIGIPQNMLSYSKQKTNEKIIDIYFSIATPYHSKVEDFAKAGAELFQVIIALERSGYRVNLYCLCGSTARGESVFMGVKIKDSKEPINIGRLSYVTQHISFLRIIFLDWYEKAPFTNTKVSDYGNPIECVFSHEKIQKDFFETFGKNSVFLSIQGILRGKRNEIFKDFSINK